MEPEACLAAVHRSQESTAGGAIRLLTPVASGPVTGSGTGVTEAAVEAAAPGAGAPTRGLAGFTEATILKKPGATLGALPNRCQREPERLPATWNFAIVRPTCPACRFVFARCFDPLLAGHHCVSTFNDFRGWCVMSVESKPSTDASIGELMAQLSSQTSRLVRDELRLAQKEFQESARHAGIGAGLFSIAGVLAFLGAATVIAAAVAALSLVLAVWAAALIVAAVLFIAAAITSVVGRNQAQEVTPAVPKTVETVKADIQELKDARHDRS